MHYYPFDINKFNAATRHMTILERGIYRELMDMYYDTERPLPDDLNLICRKLCARTEDERTAVEQVLNECFNKTARGWDNKKCSEIVREYKKQKLNASKAGKASAKARKAKRDKASNKSTPVEHPLNDRCNSVEPIKTNNQNHKSELNYIEFACFWSIYPKRVGKAAAEKSWKKLKVTDDLFNKISAHLSKAYVDTEKVFIPNPATYLNQERWNDEIIARPERETKTKLPADDKLVDFARSHMLPMPDSGETFVQYRRRLETLINREAH